MKKSNWFTFPRSGNRIRLDKIVHVPVDRSRHGTLRIWVQFDASPPIEMGADDYPVRSADYIGEDAQALLNALDEYDCSILVAA